LQRNAMAHAAPERVDARDGVRASPRALSQHPDPCPHPATDGKPPCPERLARKPRRTASLWERHISILHHFRPGRLLLTGQPRTSRDGITHCADQQNAPIFTHSAATLEEVWTTTTLSSGACSAESAANLPPLLSSNGLVVDRGFVTADERAALLAYPRKL